MIEYGTLDETDYNYIDEVERKPITIVQLNTEIYTSRKEHLSYIKSERKN